MLCKFPVPPDFCQATYNAGSEQLLNTAKYFAESSHYAVVWLVPPDKLSASVMAHLTTADLVLNR